MRLILQSLEKFIFARILNNWTIAERGESRPASDVLARLANELDVTSDNLMDGSMDDRALESISDKELLSQFQRVAKMDNKSKTVVKELLEAFLLKTDLQQKFVQ